MATKAELLIKIDGLNSQIDKLKIDMDELDKSLNKNWRFVTALKLDLEQAYDAAKDICHSEKVSPMNEKWFTHQMQIWDKIYQHAQKNYKDVKNLYQKKIKQKKELEKTIEIKNKQNGEAKNERRKSVRRLQKDS
jgi:hypothetical protein